MSGFSFEFSSSQRTTRSTGSSSPNCFLFFNVIRFLPRLATRIGIYLLSSISVDVTIFCFFFLVTSVGIIIKFGSIIPFQHPLGSSCNFVSTIFLQQQTVFFFSWKTEMILGAVEGSANIRPANVSCT